MIPTFIRNYKNIINKHKYYSSQHSRQRMHSITVLVVPMSSSFFVVVAPVVVETLTIVREID